MTQTTNGHDGSGNEHDPNADGPDSTGYTWARRSDLAPPAPAPASSESDTRNQAPASRTQDIPATEDLSGPGGDSSGSQGGSTALRTGYPSGENTGFWTQPGGSSAQPQPGQSGQPSQLNQPQPAPGQPQPNQGGQPQYGAQPGQSHYGQQPTQQGQPNQPGQYPYGPPQSPYASQPGQLQNPYARPGAPAPLHQPVGAGAPGLATPGTSTTMPIPGHHEQPPGQGGNGQPPRPAGRERRGPGWAGVAAMGVGAAVLASLLTVGVLKATDDDSVTSTGSPITNSQGEVKGPVTSSSDTSADWGAVAQAVEPSVVAVAVRTQQGEGEGSGVILDKDGRIVTNNHVVTGADEGATVNVTLSDGRTYAAKVVGTDPTTDLAVIQITDPPENITPATLGTSESAQVGDQVMAVGNPLGLAGTVTTGIISALDRPVSTSGEAETPGAASDPVVTNAIQTDAAVNPGNSGGALVDSQGRVIGIPSSIASLGSSSAFGQSGQSGSIGLGFAIPIDEVKDVTAQLIKSGSVNHSWLGVEVSTQDSAVKVDGAERSAALISTVVNGGPAAKAGIKPGDAVIAVDGEAVNGGDSLIGQLRQRTVGTQVKLSVVRGGSAQEVTVTLGTRPTSDS